MEHHPTMHPNFILNIILVSITTGFGYISVNFAEQLKGIDLVLSPIVKLCSIMSFIFFVIINYKTIKNKIKNYFK